MHVGTSGAAGASIANLQEQQFLRAAVESARCLVHAADLRTGLELALPVLRSLAGLDRVYVFVYDHVRHTVERLVEACGPGIRPLAEVHGSTSFSYGQFASLLEPLLHDETVAATHEDLDPDLQAYTRAAGTQSLLLVPIKVAGGPWGLVGFDDCTTARHFNEADVLVLRSVAATVSAAVERDEAQRQRAAAAERSARLLAAVNAASRHLLATADFDAAMRGALDALFELTGADGVFVNRYAPEERATYPWHDRRRAGLKSLADYLGPGPWPDDDFAEVSEPLRQGKVYRSRAARRGGQNKHANDAGGVITDVIVPIHVEGEYWGCIGFDNCTDERDWSDDDVAVLQNAAQAIGTAVQRVRRADRHASELARRDALLAAAAEAAGVLLHARDTRTALDKVLALWGQAGNYGRVKFLEPTVDLDGEPARAVVHEWVAVGVPLQRDSEYAVIPHHQVDKNVLKTLFVERRPLTYRTVSLTQPFQKVFTDLGVHSSANVPIFVDEAEVGVLIFDECRCDREIDAFEIDALQTCGQILATAFERDLARTREAELDTLLAARQRRHSALLSAIAVSTEQLLAASDPHRCLQDVLRRIGTVTGAMRACVARIDWTPDDASNSGWQEIEHEWTAPGVVAQRSSSLRRFAMRRDDSKWQQAMAQFERDGMLSLTIDAMAEPLRSEQRSLGVAWNLSYPIQVEGHVWGLLGFDYGGAADDNHPAEAAALKTVASAIASAIERARVEARRLAVEQQRADDAVALNRLLEGVLAGSRELLDADDLDAALDHWLSQMANAVAADAAYLGTFANDGAIGHLQRHWAGERTVALHRAVPATTDFVAWADRLKRGETIWAHLDELRDPASVRCWNESHCRTNLLMPIATQRNTLGWIGFDWRERRAWHPAYATVLRTAADSAASAMQRQAATAAVLRAQHARAEDALAAARALGRRESLMAAVAEATRELLAAADLDVALNRALAAVGTALETHRIALVFDQPSSSDDGPGRWLCTHEWFREGLAPQVGTRRGQGSYPSRDWQQQLAGSDVVLLDNPFRPAGDGAAGGAILAVSVPFVRRCWIGIACKGDRPWADYEVSALAALGSSVAAALERRDNERAREREREERLEIERKRVEEQMLARGRIAQARADELAQAHDALSRTITGLSRDGDLTRFLALVVAESQRVTTALSGAVFEYDDVRDQLSLRAMQLHGEAVTPGADPRCGPFAAPIAAATALPWAELMRTRDAVWVVVDSPQADLWPASKEWHLAQGHQLILALPVLYGDRPVGLLGLAFGDADAPRPDRARMQLLRVLVQQAGLALRLTALGRAAREADVARAQEQAARARATALARANDALLRSTASLAADGTLSHFLISLLREATQICQARAAAVFVADGRPESLHMAAFVRDGKPINISAEPHMTLWRAPVPIPIARRWMDAIRDQTHLIFDNDDVDQHHFWPDSRDWHRQQGHRCVIDVPMYAAGRLIGALSQYFDTPCPPPDFDLEQTRALAYHAALAVHLDRLAADARDTEVARERELAAQQRVRELGFANEAMRRSMLKLTSLASLNSFLDSTLIEATRSAGCGSGTVYLIERGQARLAAITIDGVSLDITKDDAALAVRFPDPPADLRPAGVLAQGRADWIDVTTDSGPRSERYRAWNAQRGNRYFVRIPMIAGGQLLGYIGLAMGGAAAQPDEQRIELARTLAQQAAVAVWTSRLAEQSRLAAAATERAQVTQRQLQESYRVNAALGRLVGQLQDERDLAALLPAMLVTCSEILGADSAYVLRADESSQSVRIDALVLDGAVLPPESGPALPVDAEVHRLWLRLQKDDTVVWGERTDLATHPAAAQWADAMRVRLFALIPLKVGATPVGAFGAAFRQAPTDIDAAGRMVETLAHYVALALRASVLGQQTRDAATLRERNRLARDIHDTLAQGFLGVVLHLRAALTLTEPAGSGNVLQERIGNALTLAESSLAEARRSVRALKPPALDRLPLHAALLEAINNQCHGHGIRVVFSAPEAAPLLDDALQAMLLRICQEAAANVVKHANARTLAVSLSQEADDLRLEIADDGIGFQANAHAAGFGLHIMRERVSECDGTFTIDTPPSGGTRIVVRCPLRSTAFHGTRTV